MKKPVLQIWSRSDPEFFFVESGSDRIYRLLNLKNKGQQFPTNKHSYSYSMYFKKEVVSVYVVSTI